MRANLNPYLSIKCDAYKITEQKIAISNDSCMYVTPIRLNAFLST